MGVYRELCVPPPDPTEPKPPPEPWSMRVKLSVINVLIWFAYGLLNAISGHGGLAVAGFFNAAVWTLASAFAVREERRR